MVPLDIISDPICPWCYIGKVEFDRALDANPTHPFRISWHPFQLNPEMPREGMDRRAYLEGKFGGKGAAAEVYAKIDARARAAGLELNFGAIERTPNTLDAHRLIHWAGIEGRQTAIVSALFAAYFEAGRDIGDAEVLCDIADGVGLDAAMIGRLLRSDADLEQIRDRDARARAMGVTGVPTFVVAEQHAVPGAQPAALWQDVMDELSAA